MSKIEAKCADCEMPYSNFGVDLVLPDQVWKVIAPDCNLLCATCICLRLEDRGDSSALLCWPNRFDYKQEQTP